MKILSKKLLLATTIVAGFSTVANAGLMSVDNAMTKIQVEPKIAAGDMPGESAPFVPAGAFTGVVSIQIQKSGGFFICTGSAISSRHIVTAAHCVEDDSGTGAVIDISQDNLNVDVVFTDGGAPITGDLGTSVRSGAVVDIHPDYNSFGECVGADVGGLFGQCLGDDLAIITLAEDIPAGVEVYDFYRGAEPLNSGTIMTMVGHGTTGNGVEGFFPGSADFFNKRFGFNIAEMFDCDDATGGGTSPDATDCADPAGAETWYADYDGKDANGADIDSMCEFVGLCGGVALGEDFDGIFEAGIGGGDSGGPSFVYDMMADKFVLAANNAFGTNGLVGAAGSYGEIFGGVLYGTYLNWIDDNFLNPMMDVNAPAIGAMIMLSVGFMGFKRRK